MEEITVATPQVIHEDQNQKLILNQQFEFVCKTLDGEIKLVSEMNETFESFQARIDDYLIKRINKITADRDSLQKECEYLEAKNAKL